MYSTNRILTKLTQKTIQIICKTKHYGSIDNHSLFFPDKFCVKHTTFNYVNNDTARLVPNELDVGDSGRTIEPIICT